MMTITYAKLNRTVTLYTSEGEEIDYPKGTLVTIDSDFEPDDDLMQVAIGVVDSEHGGLCSYDWLNVLEPGEIDV